MDRTVAMAVNLSEEFFPSNWRWKKWWKSDGKSMDFGTWKQKKDGQWRSTWSTTEVLGLIFVLYVQASQEASPGSNGLFLGSELPMKKKSDESWWNPHEGYGGIPQKANGPMVRKSRFFNAEIPMIGSQLEAWFSVGWVPDSSWSSQRSSSTISTLQRWRSVDRWNPVLWLSS